MFDHFFTDPLNPYNILIGQLSISLFVCVSVCHVLFYLNSGAQWNKKIAKLSAYVNIVLSKWFIIFGESMFACTVHEYMHATLDPHSRCSFFVILKPFLTDNEKTENTSSYGLHVTELFYFMLFLLTLHIFVPGVQKFIFLLFLASALSFWSLHWLKTKIKRPPLL